MRNRRIRVILTIALMIGAAYLFAALYENYIPSPKSDINLKKQTFAKLGQIRQAKESEVRRYFYDIKRKVDDSKNDSQLKKYFNKLLSNTLVNKQLEYELDVHYVTHYENFYDILFVDKKGNVFHSVKKEKDYHKNIFTDFSESSIAQALKNDKETSFVEFEYYSPSDEPAAFFPVAIYENDTHQGWFIFQCASNRVNSILTARKELGRTGEVYLVNRNSLMLSDSRFIPDSTILKKKIDTIAIKKALDQGYGEEIIEDYRGIKVYSSFEKLEIFDTTWILVVEIDESEILTEHFKKYPEYFSTRMIDYLTKHSFSQKAPILFPEAFKRVDINEFAVGYNTSLATLGVATCTSIAIIRPQYFTYLSHIVPSDEIYSNPYQQDLLNFYSNKTKTSLLNEIISKVRTYEIYPFELKQLNFVIVSPHAASIRGSIEQILNHGAELASIKFMYLPTARSANVFSISGENDVFVRWNKNQYEYQTAGKTMNIEEVLKALIKYDVT